MRLYILLFLISKIISFRFVTILVDTTEPVISGCPANQTITVPTGTAQATVTWTPPAVADHDTRLQSTVSHTPGSTFGLQTTPVRYTFTDGAGNSATCTFTITVIGKCYDPSTPVFSVSNFLLIVLRRFN